MSTFTDLPSLLAYQQAFVTVSQAESVQAYFGSLQNGLDASLSQWQNSQILTDAQLEKLFAEDIASKVDLSLDWAQGDSQNWLIYGAKDYPKQLMQIDDAPLLLGVRGQAELLNDPQLAIVGSRHASKQGINIAEDFARFLSDRGLIVTSGLARGIDTAAHQGALQGLAKTVAVVATGLDRIYPAANKNLGLQIVEQGVMVSEFPLGTQPLSHHFPRRNRIISGLSLGTLVVEAALQSGSLITARLASEQGREVFAVPGSIHNPQAKGCHQLIKQGAKLVESGEDILQEISDSLKPLTATVDHRETDAQTAPQWAKKLTPSAQKLLALMDYDETSLDELAVLSKMPVSSLQAELLMLELDGVIESLSAGRWRKIR
ncbi:DNA-processing protein DprA [Thiomicrorhabdus sediminis]|uniref:DNA-protecting protein DprA n=1 Tax=Thiomicrorhabdus sediminis TaxID=2580412 RepID=A0A4P9K3U3_9GAMM|nr:DNA-processing protein DprA [Thiomicrorhabdus sediminis]QCU89321.1 DNA-protecting protein DprA [Thiomicrorhabdus sediminis]